MKRRVAEAELQARIPIHEIRDQLLILADGSVAVGYQVEHLEDEAISEAGYQYLVESFTRAVQHFPVDTVIQKIDIYYQDQFAVELPPEASLLYQKQLAYYQGRPKLCHQAFLYCCFPSSGGSYSPHTTFFARGHAGLKDPFGKLARRIQVAQQYALELETTLPRGWGLSRLTDEENLAALYAYLNLDFINHPTAFENTMTTTPGYLQVGPQRLQVISMQSQAEEVAYWGYNGLGNEQGVAAPFCWPLTHYLPFAHLTVQAIRLLDTEQFFKERSSELAWSLGAKRGARGARNASIAQEELAEFEASLRERSGSLGLLSLCVLVYDAAPAVVMERVEETKKQFKRLGLLPLVESYDTANLFFAAMPGAAQQLYRGLPMSLETAVAYLNTIQPREGERSGILLSDRHRRPLYYDPFNTQLDNQHAFVFGPSGSGKSFFNGKMIKERFEAGHIVLVVDSGGTYRRLFEVLGGKYLSYSPAHPLGLNPFLIKPTEGKYKPDADKINFLVQFLGKIWKGDLNQHPLREVEKALLSKWLVKYYQELPPKAIPTLTAFYQWLSSYVKQGGKQVEQLQKEQLFPFQDFLLVVEPFARGLYKDHFNAAELDYLTDHRLVCFELEAVKSHPKLYPLVVQVLFDFALEVVAAHPEATKYIDIEEGWSMLDDYAEEHIEGFFRKGRKTKTSIRLITQSIDEIKNSRIAGAMKNNASTLILLYNEKHSSREEIGDFLGLNAFDRSKYESLRRQAGQAGYREVFIKEMSESQVWLVETSPYEYALLTSKPDERNRLSRLVEEQGDVVSGICAWVQERKQLAS